MQLLMHDVSKGDLLAASNIVEERFLKDFVLRHELEIIK